MRIFVVRSSLEQFREQSVFRLVAMHRYNSHVQTLRVSAESISPVTGCKLLVYMRSSILCTLYHGHSVYYMRV